jgi:predicted phosphoadenosine phosphosulfate sulfurtransferase
MKYKLGLGIDVVTAARARIRSIFANGLPVYMSFSGGKDSLTLAHLTLELIRAGEIDASRLTVIFIDEEAIFPCVDRVVRQWRETFLMAGAKFDWYCIEVRHYSCLNMLENDESFFCWDSTKQDVWIRQPPAFALRSHPLLKPRVHTYQEFLMKLCDRMNMTGVRNAESIQRRQAFAERKRDITLALNNTIAPLYDWRDHDVWLYLRDHAVEIPEVYHYLFQIDGAQSLRISQFFSIDTARSLADMDRYYPGLMRAILKREPNAYLVSLYYHTELFRRRTRTRRVLEEQQSGGVATNYREAVAALFANIPANFPNKSGRFIARHALREMLKAGTFMTDDDYRSMYELLVAGDPKRRALRALLNSIWIRYDKAAYAHGPAAPGDERPADRARPAAAE